MLSLDPGNSLDKPSQLPAGIFSHHDFMGQDHLLILSAWGLSSPDELDLFLAAKGENLRTRKSTGTRLDRLLTHKVFFIFLKSFNLPRNVDVATPRVSELWNSHSFFIFSTRKKTFECRLSSSLTPQEMCTIMILKYIFHTFPENQRNFQKKLPKKLVVPPPLFGICCWEFPLVSERSSNLRGELRETHLDRCSVESGRLVKFVQVGRITERWQTFPTASQFCFFNKYSLFETQGGVIATALLVAWIITRIFLEAFLDFGRSSNCPGQHTHNLTNSNSWLVSYYWWFIKSGHHHLGYINPR